MQPAVVVVAGRATADEAAEMPRPGKLWRRRIAYRRSNPIDPWKQGEEKAARLTELIQHLVALVQHKVLDLCSIQLLVPRQREHSPGRADGNVRARLLLAELLDVGRDGRSAVEDLGADIGHELGEPQELVLDLEGELSGVAQDDDRRLAVDRLTGVEPSSRARQRALHLLQGGQDEDGGLTHTRLGLAEDVRAEDGLRDALLLHWRKRARTQAAS